MVFGILEKIRDQVFRAVLDTGAKLCIVARRLLNTFKKPKTLAIRVGDGRTIQSLGGVDVTICLGDETVIQHCRVLDTDAFDIVIGTDFLRRNPQVKVLSLQAPILYTATLAVGSFPYLWSCQDENSLGCATQQRLTIVLKTTNWPVTFLKMEWRPCRYPWMRSGWNCLRANNSTSCTCIARNI